MIMMIIMKISIIIISLSPLPSWCGEFVNKHGEKHDDKFMMMVGGIVDNQEHLIIPIIIIIIILMMVIIMMIIILWVSPLSPFFGFSITKTGHFSGRASGLSRSPGHPGNSLCGAAGTGFLNGNGKSPFLRWETHPDFKVFQIFQVIKIHEWWFLGV